MEAQAYDFDLALIGGGSGGLACSREARRANPKARICVFDFVEPTPRGTKWGIGGTCVNVGCIPKKLMHQAALIGGYMKDAPSFGWELEPGQIQHNWNTLVQKVQNHIHSANFGYRTALRQETITWFNAFARFADPHTLEYTLGGETKRITAERIVIACGGRPTYPNVEGAQELCITSDDFFSLDHAPGKTLVVGASYVALECAGLMAELGMDVTVMVRSIPLRGFDQDMAYRVCNYMEEHGVKFMWQTVPTRFTHLECGRTCVHYRHSPPNQPATEGTEGFDTVLLATGRTPNTTKLQLERAGVTMDPATKKIPCTNEQTNVPHIYCIGDALLGVPELTPTAIRAGQLLARRIFGASEELMDYRNVATTVFTPLEYGIIGMAEDDAMEQYGGDNIECFHSFFYPLEWKISEPREGQECYLKMITHKADKNRLLGFHYMGPNAGEVTDGWGLAFKLGATKADVEATIGIHPTTAEEVNLLHVTKSSMKTPHKGSC